MRPGEKALTRLTEYTDGRDPSTSKTDSLRSSIFSALDDNLLGTGYWVLDTTSPANTLPCTPDSSSRSA